MLPRLRKTPVYRSMFLSVDYRLLIMPCLYSFTIVWHWPEFVVFRQDKINKQPKNREILIRISCLSTFLAFSAYVQNGIFLFLEIIYTYFLDKKSGKECSLPFLYCISKSKSFLKNSSTTLILLIQIEHIKAFNGIFLILKIHLYIFKKPLK